MTTKDVFVQHEVRNTKGPPFMDTSHANLQNRCKCRWLYFFYKAITMGRGVLITLHVLTLFRKTPRESEVNFDLHMRIWAL